MEAAKLKQTRLWKNQIYHYLIVFRDLFEDSNSSRYSTTSDSLETTSLSSCDSNLLELSATAEILLKYCACGVSWYLFFLKRIVPVILR